MRVEIKQITSWQRVLDVARATVGKKPLGKEPSKEWKRKILLAEHSPIRLLEFDIYLYDIPNFVSVHLVRHHIGIEKFVTSKREDRSSFKNEEVNRITPTDMILSCNAQALINISRKRLCSCASKETRQVWEAVKEEMKKVDEVVAEYMVADCEYRGRCTEGKNCKLNKKNKNV